MFAKNKIINHLTQKGKKTKSEKILNKSTKELQKNSKKQTKKLIQLSIVLSSIMFKTRIIKNKKNRKKKNKIIPTFIYDKNKRFSFAIKLIIQATKENYNNCFHKKLKDEFFSTVILKNKITKTKKDLEKQTIKKKKYVFKYYRWF